MGWVMGWSGDRAGAAGFAAGVAVIVALFVGLAGCGPSGNGPPAGDSRGGGSLRVVVTVAPLRSIVERLAPAGSEVSVLMAPGRSEHGYEFTPSDLVAAGRADVLVCVGLGLEPAIEAFARANPSNRRQTVVLGEALGLSKPGRRFEAHDHDAEAGHAHGPECAHELDPHVWLDPVLMKQGVPALRAAVERALEFRGGLTGAARGVLDQAERSLAADLEALDREHVERLAPFRGRSIVTHHAAFVRLADRYGLKVAAVLRPIETSEPTAAQLGEAMQAIRRENVPVIFIEPQFNPEAAERLASAAGIGVGRLDPLGDGDYFKLMRTNLAELAAKLAVAPASASPDPPR
jgi:ABC-type Zn uptake system ZnuABC Zn-binding protein ZnuA